MGYTINIAKESHKFSCTHFTIFSATKAERMHGHNYRVSVQIELENVISELGMAFDFNEVKPQIKSLCEELDEYILLPENSPYLSLDRNNQQIQIRFDQKSYSLPIEDVKLLPLVNITTEELSRYFCMKLSESFAQLPLTSVSVTIQETQGQSVTFRQEVSKVNPKLKSV